MCSVAPARPEHERYTRGMNIRTTFLATLVAVAGFVIGMAQDPLPKVPCQELLKGGLDAWLDKAAEIDPSTHGVVGALDYYTGCLVTEGDKHLKTASAARQATIRDAVKATESLLIGQWRIHGADGGTMFQIFMASDRTFAADLRLKMADPKMQKGGAVPKTLLQDESAYLTKASDRIRAFLPIVAEITKDENRPTGAKEEAKAGLKQMVEAWESIQSMASRLTSIDRLRIYKTLDQRLEPNWAEDGIIRS